MGKNLKDNFTRFERERTSVYTKFGAFSPFERRNNDVSWGNSLYTGAPMFLNCRHDISITYTYLHKVGNNNSTIYVQL